MRIAVPVANWSHNWGGALQGCGEVHYKVHYKAGCGVGQLKEAEQVGRREASRKAMKEARKRNSSRRCKGDQKGEGNDKSGFRRGQDGRQLKTGKVTRARQEWPIESKNTKARRKGERSFRSCLIQEGARISCLRDLA